MRTSGEIDTSARDKGVHMKEKLKTPHMWTGKKCAITEPHVISLCVNCPKGVVWAPASESEVIEISCVVGFRALCYT